MQLCNQSILIHLCVLRTFRTFSLSFLQKHIDSSLVF
nr:MAG TPA: hypothetical protein [Bacteriophage sp.]